MTKTKSPAYGYRVREMTPDEIEFRVKRIEGICASHPCAGRIGMEFCFLRRNSLGEPFATIRRVCPSHGSLYAARHNVKVEPQEGK